MAQYPEWPFLISFVQGHASRYDTIRSLSKGQESREAIERFERFTAVDQLLGELIELSST